MVEQGGTLLTVDEAAAELSLCSSTIRMWMYQNRIGFVRLGRAVRIPRDEIRRLREVGFVPATKEAD